MSKVPGKYLNNLDVSKWVRMLHTSSPREVARKTPCHLPMKIEILRVGKRNHMWLT